MLQYNVQHSKDKVLVDLIADERVREMDILAIQEPWTNSRDDRKGYCPSGSPFTLISTATEKTRAAIYINRRIRSEDLEVVRVEDSLVTVNLRLQIGEEKVRVAVHSAYNKPPESISTREIPEQLEAIVRAISNNDIPEQVLLGDFNLHHPAWGGEGCGTHRLAADLIQATGVADLEQILPEGTITRDIIKNTGQIDERREQTTVDLAFCSDKMRRRILSCRVREDLNKGSDHLPIETVFALERNAKEEALPPVRAWKRLDVDRFKATFQATADLLPSLQLENRQDIDNFAKILVEGAQQAAVAATPLERKSTHDKDFWTAECTEKVIEASRLRWEARKKGTLEARRLAQIATAIKGKVLKAAKQRAFRQAMQEASQVQGKLWKIAKWARKKARKELEPDYFPALEKGGRTAISTEEKVEIFYQECFPEPPRVDLSDIEGASYTHQLDNQPEANWEVTAEEQSNAIANTKPDKAPGDDSLPNRVIKLLASVIGEQLRRLFSACLKVGHHAEAFRRAITVVLRKPGKTTYTDPGAYRPIALLNTLGKVLEAIVAKRISKLAERCSLLPDQQYGARPGRSTETALLNITEQVRASWERDSKCVVTLLSMDVAKAFDRVSHPRLLHNLRVNSVPERLVKWVESFLQDRRTSIRIGGYTSETRRVSVGIPQGSPLSPILYLFYNASLIRECTIPSIQSGAMAFVDDNNVFITGTSTKETIRKFERIEEVCRKWERTHGSKFNRDKFHMVHLTKARRDDLDRPLVLNGQTIRPEPHIKVLGVLIDKKLTGQAHLRQVMDRAPEYVKVLKTIAGSTWGATLGAAREVYLRMVRPALSYGALLWFRPSGILPAAKGMMAKLRTIQGRCLRAVAGAYKATSVEALEAETHVEPLDIYISQIALQAAARNTLSPAFNGINMRAEKVLRGVHNRGPVPKLVGPLQALTSWVERKMEKPLRRSQEAEEEVRKKADKKLLKEVKMTTQAAYKQEWQQRWARAAKGGHSRRLQPSLSETPYRHLAKMKRPVASMVIQLRTGKIGFGLFLFTMKVPGYEDPFCHRCEEGKEMSVEHVLMECPAWTEMREECFSRAFRRGARPTLEGLLGTTKGCKAAAKMVQRTELLAQFSSCDLEAIGEEDVVDGEEDGEEDEGI